MGNIKNSEEYHLHNHLCENLKSYIKNSVCLSRRPRNPKERERERERAAQAHKQKERTIQKIFCNI
jgi:hypothetical protein